MIRFSNSHTTSVLLVLMTAIFFCSACNNATGSGTKQANIVSVKPAKSGLARAADTGLVKKPDSVAVRLPIDTANYSHLALYLAHNKVTPKWPVKTPFPLPGAILPFKRVIAFYGNFYSKRMGILGEIPPAEMLKKLHAECKMWAKADSAIPVQPALQYICVSAQHEPGKAGKFRMRMPFTQIDKAIALAKQAHAIVFLDVQVGQSTLQQEIPQLEQYLKMDIVHLGVDPEFSMKNGAIPGSRIGTFDASEINWTTNYLAGLVRQYHLTPKILIVHRFTMKMVSNYKEIKTRPEVQFVMDMDGWGFPAKKVDTYEMCVRNNPVQFTGFKLFYKNDIKTKGFNVMMTPKAVLALTPSPIYIQYQ